MVARRRPVSTALTALILAPLPALAQSPIAIIGGESALAGQEIGQLGPMLVTDRHVLVFDKADKLLRVYDLNGASVQSVGQSGAGPGEFRFVYAMARDSAGHVLLLDPATGRVTTYIEGDTLRLLGTRPIELSGYGLCTTGDTLFVSGSQGSGMVHQFELGARAGRALRSFGKSQLRGSLGQNQMIRERLGNSPIACVPGEPVVMPGSRDLGVIQIMRTDMQDERVVALPGFERMTITPGNGSLTFGVPESGHYDMLVTMRPARGGAIAIVHRVTGRTNDSIEYRRYFITATGAVQLLGKSAWHQIGAGRGKVYCAGENPFPEVVVFQGVACP
jgi:hypothetical protein